MRSARYRATLDSARQTHPERLCRALQRLVPPRNTRAYLFTILRRVRHLLNEWVYDYNTLRPRQALGFSTPMEFKQAV